MVKREIPYYSDYLSDELLDYLKREGRSIGVPGLVGMGEGGGLESPESLKFLCDLYDSLKAPLNIVLQQRVTDREFIDRRTKACVDLNRSLGIDLLDARYHTIIGQEDASGRVVMGPFDKFYCRRGKGQPIAPLPEFLKGHHVTLFGPPDDAKLSINAMNAIHRKIGGEPAIIDELVRSSSDFPKWGADDEDSKTPLRKDLVAAGVNLTRCADGTISFTDKKSQKKYALESERLALPIKRFPGLALPCLFLLYRENPIPLHLYDFALHLFKNWHNPKALSFYVPKLETEDEAKYIHLMVETTEAMIKKLHPEYVLGTVRLFIVLENPRAIFRVNEIMDALYPYFAGASLGWHDYLGSTARLFKNDPNYRIPVKADPDIVIKYIKASHDLLAEVVGSRGGIKIGGMYGVLPMENDLMSPSFQIAIKGFIKDVITQMKRDLSGFWVAHPDFVRIAIALVEAWTVSKNGVHSKESSVKLETLVKSLLDERYHSEILGFIRGPDLVGLDTAKLDTDDPRYARSLIVADIKESTYIANNHPDEIRYNVFQSLQYLTDWLCGNGCVALPAQIDDTAVRVMDDLATAERSRWEVWHEIHHGRVPIDTFLRIAHEELRFIRKDLSDGKKIVQVKWDERTEKWYPIAFKIMVQLMTSEKPVEFATELLLPFTVDTIRNAKDPWAAALKADPKKYHVSTYVERFNYFFEICGVERFAHEMANCVAHDLDLSVQLVQSFDLEDIKAAASFHGDIGEAKRTLDERAAREQSLIAREDEALKTQLRILGEKYVEKFGVKFLISAQGRSGREIMAALEKRLENSVEQEHANARHALTQINLKRLNAEPIDRLKNAIVTAIEKHEIIGAQVAIASAFDQTQSLSFGERIRGQNPVTPETLFEIASLSKSVASAFALEYFRKKQISLNTPVNSLLAKSSSTFRLQSLDRHHPEWADKVTLEHLMNHGALNMHYVNGIPANRPMLDVKELINGNAEYSYSPIGVQHDPGTTFQYSGGGFLVLEHLIQALEGESIQKLTEPFLAGLGLKNLTFNQETEAGRQYAYGYEKKVSEVAGTRKMFPAFAAGAMGTAQDMMHFLSHLAKAHQSLEGSGPISHDTAVRMLYPNPWLASGSSQFMHAKIGVGIFVCEAGPNRFAVHQGANDGFRSLFLYCFEGPDAGKGFTIFCNADFNGVLFIAEAAQAIFRELKLQGVDSDDRVSKFAASKFKPEEVVNQAYKALIFSRFQTDLPEAIVERGPKDPLAAHNLAVGATIDEVSNQRFARAENLVSANLPVFDPTLFGRQGKIMDSWETVRHNLLGQDTMVFTLAKPSIIQFVSLSTQYHLGNHASAVMLEGFVPDSDAWKSVLPRTELDGHSIKKIQLPHSHSVISRVRVTMFPDGGLTRLGLFGPNLAAAPRAEFKPIAEAISIKCTEPISQTHKPLTPKYDATSEIVAANWSRLKPGSEVDIASSAYGGKIVSASNEHYGPAVQIISPYSPIHMFDGFESARSREAGHSENVVIALGRKSKVHRIVVDFTYFKNNNPLELMVEGLAPSGWTPLIARSFAKPYAGNRVAFAINCSELLEQIRVTVFPDGGMNRVHVYSQS